MTDRPATTAAAAGAAALLGLPVVAAGLATDAPAEPPIPIRAVVPDPLAQAQKETRYWRRKARRNWRYALSLRRTLRDPVRAGLLCIHSGEGGWGANTGNGYFGGLQMDRSFQWTYGRPLVQRFGFAHRWPSAAQLAVGEIAFYAGRGFAPWPNTSRACGL